MTLRARWSATLIALPLLLVSPVPNAAGVNINTPTASPSTNPTATLVWSDDFSGPAGLAPDSSKWRMDVGGYGFGHNELQYYTARATNVATDGLGNLAITARRETYSDLGHACSYTAGKIETRGLFATIYGSIQARIKLPAGSGLWPAFWAVGADIDQVGSPECGEIDIMENLGRDPYTVYAHIHGPTAPATPAGYALGDSTHSAKSLADGFHIYGVNWSPSSIEMTLDGVVYATYGRSSLLGNQRWVFDKPFYLLLNVAVGGDWPGCPDETTSFPATMLVDWVRVYSTPEDAAGPVCAAKNVTVRHDKACRIHFQVYDSLSSEVARRLVITGKAGVVMKRWSWTYAKTSTKWSSVQYTCRLRRGTYCITATGWDKAGNPASVVGRAKLVVQ